MNTDIHFSSKKQDWETPPELFAPLDDEFEFTVDVCAEAHNTKCPRYFSPEIDGLKQDWSGEVCWCNPPYDDAASWIEKASRASLLGAVVVMLIPARTDTRYWHDFVMKADEIRLIKGRVRFVGADASAPFPSCIVVFRSTPRKRPIVRAWHWKSEQT